MEQVVIIPFIFILEVPFKPSLLNVTIRKSIKQQIGC